MPHLNKQDKIQEQMDRQFSDDTNREWEEKIREVAEKIIDLAQFGNLHVNDILPDLQGLYEQGLRDGKKSVLDKLRPVVETL